jgi:Domain of unknown function (DUF1992)
VRKPLGEPFETFVDRLINEAREAGELDNLPGQGLPLRGLDDPPDEMWWLKEKMRREALSFVPDALAVRRELEALLAALPAMPEGKARELLVALDARIRKMNATVTSGPPTTVAPLDVEALLARSRK